MCCRSNFHSGDFLNAGHIVFSTLGFLYQPKLFLFCPSVSLSITLIIIKQYFWIGKKNEADLAGFDLPHFMAFSDKTLLIQLDLVYLRHKYCSILFDIVQYYWTTHSQYVGQHISINIYMILVGSVGRAPVCWAWVHGFEPKLDQHSGS